VRVGSAVVLAGVAALARLGVHPVAPPAGPVPLAKHCSAAPQLVYNGGPVLQNVEVYEVNWGTQISTTVTQQLPQFYADVVASPYFDWLSEYDTIGLTGPGGTPGSNQGISRGTFAGSVTIVPSFCNGTGAPNSCPVTDAQVRAELVAQIAAGFLPPPTKGCDGQPDTLYMVNFDASVEVTTNSGQSTCVDICAYHGTSAYQGQDFAYAVLPDVSTGPCAGAGCGLATNTVLQNTTAVASHELVESVTDGLAPLAWTDPTCGEIADICLLLYGTIAPNGTTWTVTQLWSNAANDCITTKASLPAVCTGPDTPAGCRPCACSDDNQGAPGEPGCSGATPTCQVDTTSFANSVCGGSVGAPDSGAPADSGAAQDSGAPADSGAAQDSGASPDSGGPADGGGVPVDSGSASDASSTPPSGVDAGDAGESATPVAASGCSCRSAGGRAEPASSVLLGLALLAGLRLRRRPTRTTLT